MQPQMQVPVEVLVRQLQHIPGLRVSIEYVEEVPFEDWARHWLETYKKGIVKDNTYRSTYLEPVELHIVPYFQGQALKAITPDEVQVFFRSLTDKFALETLKKIRNALRLIFEAAIEHHMCFDNPVTHSLRLVSHIPPAEKHTWSADEYATAYQYALHHKCGLEVIALMETAMSRSELLGLCWSDLNVKHRLLTLRNGLVCQRSTDTGKYCLVHDGLKNKYRQRDIPLSPLLCGLLALRPRTVAVAGKQIHPKHIFCAPDGGAYDPRNWYRRVLQRFMRDLHEDTGVSMLTTHELRHTRATLLKDSGADLFSIARLLGHSDLNMLAKRYAHDNVETLRKALSIDIQT